MTAHSNSPSTGVTPAISLQSLAPIGLFLVVNRLAGLRWAVVAATVWSIKVIVDRRRKGIPLGKFMPIVTAAVVVRGAIGAITGSETVYFGLGIATKYLAAAVLAGSAILRKPLAAKAAPHVLELPPAALGHPTFRSTMAQMTLIASAYYAISASFDIWLFRRSSVEGFVVVRFLANWPLSTAAIVAALGLAQVRLRRIPDLAPLSTLLERRMTSYLPDDDQHGGANDQDAGANDQETTPNG